MNFIKVIDNLGIPKYKQIVQSIENAIVEGSLKKGDQLPSINSIRKDNSLSRDTVLLAFNELKIRGIVLSIAGKGYYVKSENINIKRKIFLLFDELNSFKEDLYNSFLNSLEDNIEVDIYFHHFNPEVFSKLIYESNGNYNSYIIMPANLKNTHIDIAQLPKDKVYILDQSHPELSGYSAIFQNFEKDIYSALSQESKIIKRYRKFIFIFPELKQPKGMLIGFKKFCKEHGIDHEVIGTFDNKEIDKGEIYLIPDDRNLIRVIKKKKEKGFILAKDVGIISYNETLLKEIVRGGITTISTDFKYMGGRLAQMIMDNEHVQIENPSSLILRNSV